MKREKQKWHMMHPWTLIKVLTIIGCVILIGFILGRMFRGFILEFGEIGISPWILSVILIVSGIILIFFGSTLLERSKEVEE